MAVIRTNSYWFLERPKLSFAGSKEPKTQGKEQISSSREGGPSSQPEGNERKNSNQDCCGDPA